MLAEVAVLEVVLRPEASGEEAAPERAVRDEADPELARRLEDAVLGVARPQRVLGLERSDRVHRVGAPDRVGRRLGEAQVADLPLRDELRHRADRLLDRDGLVDAVLVIEIDVVDVQPTERRLDGRAHVFRASVDAAGSVLPDEVRELRGEDHFVAAVGDRPADELLVLAEPRSVHVGGIEEGDAEVERAVNRRDRLVLVCLAVPGRHSHTAEALRRDLERLSERPFLHALTVPADGTAAWSGYTGRRSWLSRNEKRRNRAATSAARPIRSARRR